MKRFSSSSFVALLLALVFVLTPVFQASALAADPLPPSVLSKEETAKICARLMSDSQVQYVLARATQARGKTISAEQGAHGSARECRVIEQLAFDGSYVAMMFLNTVGTHAVAATYNEETDEVATAAEMRVQLQDDIYQVDLRFPERQVIGRQDVNAGNSKVILDKSLGINTALAERTGFNSADYTISEVADSCGLVCGFVSVLVCAPSTTIGAILLCGCNSSGGVWTSRAKNE